ncbi:hypothetical protein Tco_0825593 [Tanacetum coccineum]
MAEGADKPEAQWTLDERMVVNQDQHLKSIIISCLPDDIIESVISYETAKDTWTDLVHNFEGPFDTKFKKQMRTLDVTNVAKKVILQEIAFLKRLNKSPSSYSSSVSKCFQLKFTPKLIQSSQHTLSSQVKPKAQKDYKTKYKKLKAKLALLEASSPTSQSSKPFQSKNKGLVAETFDWDEEEVSDDDKETRVQVLMALADGELSVGKNHARNGEWINITMKKLNHALQDQLKRERKVNEKWLNSSNKVSQCIIEQIPSKKKKILGGEQLTDSSSKNNAKDNPFVPTSLDYDYVKVSKSKDWVERLNLDRKLPNFNTERILVPEGEVVNECLQLTESPSDFESLKESGSESQTPLPTLKNL